MSSNSNKQPQAAVQALQSQLQQTKKQLLQLNTSLQSIQSHNSTLMKQNSRLEQEYNELKDSTDLLISNQGFNISILEDRIRELIREKRDLEIELGDSKVSYQALRVEYEVYKETQQDQLENVRNEYQDRCAAYQKTENEYKSAINQYQKLSAQVSQLKQSQSQQIQNFQKSLSDKQRQKIQSIDSIKQQMLAKATIMRNNALQIRKEQLQITTRLTFLQNDQLVRELEYQANKTEEILKRNKLLEGEVRELKGCLRVHEDVEKEIMKRNVVSKNIITNLNHQIMEIRNKYQHKHSPKGILKKGSKQNPQVHIKQQIQLIASSQTSIGSTPKHDSSSQPKPKPHISPINEQQQQNEVQPTEAQKIAILEQTLKTLQKQVEKLQKQNTQLLTSNQNLRTQLQDMSKRGGGRFSNQIFGLLDRFYQQIVVKQKQEGKSKNKQNEKSKKEKEAIKIQGLNDEDLGQVQSWPIQFIQKIIKLLLNNLKPYINSKILKLPYFHSSPNGKPTQNLKQLTSQDYQSLKQNMNASKYLKALKRQRNKSLQAIKQRSLTYVIGSQGSNVVKSKNMSSHRRISTTNVTRGMFEPLAKRFLKSSVNIDRKF